MASWKTEAIIVAIGMTVLGGQIKQGVNKFVEKDRVVTVKGLAEMEVPANKVTWPLVYKEVGNDLGNLYDKIKATNQTIVGFLKSKGISEEEISINAPEIIDMQAERYNSNPVPFRYNVTTVITVTSDKVELVRSLISEQGELLKQGVAITGGDYRYNVEYDFTGLNTPAHFPYDVHFHKLEQCSCQYQIDQRIGKGHAVHNIRTRRSIDRFPEKIDHDQIQQISRNNNQCSQSEL